MRSATEARVRVMGQELPADLARAIQADVSLPLLGEGPLVAGPVFGAALAVVGFVFFGAVFFPDMQRPSPAGLRVVLLCALVVGLWAALAGWRVSRGWRRAAIFLETEPAAAQKLLHRTVARGRLLVAMLLLALGLSAPWHAGHATPGLGLASLLAWGAALTLGALKLPTQLGFMAGQRSKAAGAAAWLDRWLFVGIGLLGVIVSLPPVAQAAPGRFFILLTQVLNLMVTPWVIPLLAVAHLHDQAGMKEIGADGG